MEEKLKAFGKLLEIMDRLRAECPWDRKQTFESLRKLTIEETYELADAILKADSGEIKNELGDLLLHIVFYAKIGSEQCGFDILDVLHTINEKLIYRHPHIYGNVKVKDDEEVKHNWEELKLKEGNRTVLGGVPGSLPALVKANRIQEKVRGVGFDWEKKEEIWEKLDEEIEEVKHELSRMESDISAAEGLFQKIEEEFGDLFFTLINAARLYGIDPENALERTNIKFIKRFNLLEEMTRKKGKKLPELTIEEMDQFWEEAKVSEK
ncbi:MAG: nucleoside triphosphate pyrophosphohydrolase [Bacteroidales bacterium]|nr:MAG: nucleoside triphosphate pyrophosphohydrolase [Bacteroidales bacterium]